MSLGILKQINWVDIFAVIVLLRIAYISIKSGMPLELFKLFGTLAAVYLSLHYYLVLAGRFPKNIPPQAAEPAALLILVAAGYFAIALLRQVFMKFFKVEPVPNLNKWGGVIFGILRGFLTLSLIFFILVVSPLPYFRNSVKDSYSGKFIFGIAPQAYGILWNGLISKFAPAEKFNSSIPDIRNSPEIKK